MVTTTTPMTMRMTGSIRLMAAVRLVWTSSSKNSATELSICGQRAGGFADFDHLDGELGEDAGGVELAARPLPSRTVSTEVKTALEIWRESMERAAVSRMGRAAGRR